MNIGAENRNLNLIILVAALINSIAGIVVTLYATALPSIAHDLNASIISMQNTISISIISYAFGQITFGILCDWIGRKFTIMIGLSIFILASLVGAFANSIAILMLARIFQGFAVGSCQVVARAVVIDNVKGPRFKSAITYLSVSFALGLIIAPYLGAEILRHINWRADFWFYAIYGMTILFVVIFKLKESMPAEHASLPHKTLATFSSILKNKIFILSSFQLGCSFIAFTLWNQVGPFIIENELGKSATYFGVISLITGVTYLAGSMLNIVLIPYTKITSRLNLSTIFFILGIILILPRKSRH
jgi:MFS family permease